MKHQEIKTSKRQNNKTSILDPCFGFLTFRRFDFWLLGQLAAAAVVFLADSAMAQTPGRVPGEDAGYLQWVIFGGIAVVVCATGFLNSKRSHLN